MSEVRAVIFDCDGVMFESRRANLAYYNQILAKFSCPPVLPDQEERAHLCHTASSPVVLKTLLGEEQLSAALTYAAGLDYREFIPFMAQEPQLIDIFEQLKGHYSLAVATNRGYSIKAILAHFDLADYFSVVVTCHDVAAPKPAPDMLLLAAEQLGFSSDNCLFVGDSVLDRQAADGAGMAFVGYGEAQPGELNITRHLELLNHL
jgi:HAD superfamily hydrolase (TIGR01509 family)